MMMCTATQDTVFIMGLPVRIPGRDLDDNALYQFVETDQFALQDGQEYGRILKMGWQNWYGELLCKIQNPPYTDPGQLFARFGQMGQNMAKMAMHFIPQGIAPLSHFRPARLCLIPFPRPIPWKSSATISLITRMR